jgi:hypothetical protein
VGMLVALSFAIAVVTTISLLPPDARSELALKTLYGFGFFLPSLVVGAAIGWISYSRRVWGYSTAVLVAATMLLFVFHSHQQNGFLARSVSSADQQPRGVYLTHPVGGTPRMSAGEACKRYSAEDALWAEICKGLRKGS